MDQIRCIVFLIVEKQADRGKDAMMVTKQDGMKKAYVRPCIIESVKIEPDQAIAACGAGSQGSSITHKGYINGSTYGLGNIKSSQDEAAAVNEHCPVYDAFYVYKDGNNHGYVYDSIPDGKYQPENYVNNSDVQGLWNEIANMFQS